MDYLLATEQVANHPAMPLLALPRRWNNIAQTQLAKNIT
jgi:hypothetical protein